MPRRVGSGAAGMSVRRLAAYDVGTNSTRLLVGDVDDGRIVAEVERAMVITRLGRGVDRTRRFDAEALRRTLAVIEGYAATCRRLGVEAARLVTTSATRDATNREEFLAGARRLVGVEPEVLTGAEEAAAAYLGATADLAARADLGGTADPGATVDLGAPADPGATAGLDGGGRTLVVDIGGGSTEFILGARVPEGAVSVDIGCVRLTERHLHTDPPTRGEIAALRDDVARHLAEVTAVLDPSSATLVIGVAGTVTTVAAITLGLDAYDPRRIHRAVVGAADIRATAGRLSAMTVAERAALPVMAAGRQDVIAAGALVLDVICSTFGFGEVMASETDILDGVLLGLAARHPAGR